MKELKTLIDEKKTIQAGASSTWKKRILDFLLEQKGYSASVEDVLKATDPEFNGSNTKKRKHCLDSQKTYMKSMFEDDKTVGYLGVATEYAEGQIKLIGVYTDEDTIHPFK